MFTLRLFLTRSKLLFWALKWRFWLLHMGKPKGFDALGKRATCYWKWIMYWSLVENAISGSRLNCVKTCIVSPYESWSFIQASCNISDGTASLSAGADTDPSSFDPLCSLPIASRSQLHYLYPTFLLYQRSAWGSDKKDSIPKSGHLYTTNTCLHYWTWT